MGQREDAREKDAGRAETQPSSGGLSGWGEAEQEPKVMEEVAKGVPPEAASPQGHGDTETDPWKPNATLAPPKEQGRSPESGRDAVAGMGEVEAGQGRREHLPPDRAARPPSGNKGGR